MRHTDDHSSHSYSSGWEEVPSFLSQFFLTRFSLVGHCWCTIPWCLGREMGVAPVHYALHQGMGLTRCEQIYDWTFYLLSSTWSVISIFVTRLWKNVKLSIFLHGIQYPCVQKATWDKKTALFHAYWLLNHQKSVFGFTRHDDKHVSQRQLWVCKYKL